jgi:hypothetical protein
MYPMVSILLNLTRTRLWDSRGCVRRGAWAAISGRNMNLSCCRSFLHDPAVYPEPESFKPERFLRTNSDGSLSVDPDVPDPRNALFGYGRRVCPGKHQPSAQATTCVEMQCR